MYLKPHLDVKIAAQKHLCSQIAVTDSHKRCPLKPHDQDVLALGTFA